MDNNVDNIGKDKTGRDIISENFRNTNVKDNNLAEMDDKAVKVQEISFKIYNSKQ